MYGALCKVMKRRGLRDATNGRTISMQITQLLGIPRQATAKGSAREDSLRHGDQLRAKNTSASATSRRAISWEER